MFNLFNIKHNLIPKDVNNGMLTSLFTTFKVDEKIDIPENVICFIRFKDKTYKEISTGTYSLNKEFLLDLYTKQLKNKKKLKVLKADLYFINLNTFNIEFEYTTKIIYNHIKSKILFNIKVNVNVNDAKKFKNFIIYENNSARSIDTEKILINYLEDLCKRFYLKKNLSSLTVDSETKQELFAYINKYLNKIGVVTNDLNITLFKHASIGKIEQTTSNFFSKTESIEESSSLHSNSEQIVENTSNSVDQPKENNYTKNSTNKETCSQCGCVIIKGSIFCHKCGYKR